MNPYPTPHLLIAALFLLMLWTPVLAQEAQDVSDTTLSEEAYRHEIETYVTTPCIVRAVDETPMSEYFNGKEFLHLIETEPSEPFATFKQDREKMIAEMMDVEGLGQVREKPESVRKAFFKLTQKACLVGMKKGFNRGAPEEGQVVAPETATSDIENRSHEERETSPKLLNRDSLWDRMKELDDMVNQQAQDFDEMEQERLHAVERRQASVPEAVRHETLKRCKKKFERVEKAGFGGGSWSLLQSCVSTELDAYLDLKQTYGDSLLDSSLSGSTDSTR